jgi:hypothetical protein
MSSVCFHVYRSVLRVFFFDLQHNRTASLLSWERFYLWSVDLLMPSDTRNLNRQDIKSLQRYLAVIVPFFPGYIILILTANAVARPLMILAFSILCTFGYGLKKQFISIRFAQWTGVLLTLYVMPVSISGRMRSLLSIYLSHYSFLSLLDMKLYGFSSLEAFVFVASYHPTIALLCFGGGFAGNTILAFDFVLLFWCKFNSEHTEFEVCFRFFFSKQKIA